MVALEFFFTVLLRVFPNTLYFGLGEFLIQCTVVRRVPDTLYSGPESSWFTVQWSREFLIRCTVVQRVLDSWYTVQWSREFLIHCTMYIGPDISWYTLHWSRQFLIRSTTRVSQMWTKLKEIQLIRDFKGCNFQISGQNYFLEIKKFTKKLWFGVLRYFWVGLSNLW